MRWCQSSSLWSASLLHQDGEAQGDAPTAGCQPPPSTPASLLVTVLDKRGDRLRGPKPRLPQRSPDHLGLLGSGRQTAFGFSKLMET